MSLQKFELSSLRDKHEEEEKLTNEAIKKETKKLKETTKPVKKVKKSRSKKSKK